MMKYDEIPEPESGSSDFVQSTGRFAQLRILRNRLHKVHRRVFCLTEETNRSRCGLLWISRTGKPGADKAKTAVCLFALG